VPFGAFLGFRPRREVLHCALWIIRDRLRKKEGKKQEKKPLMPSTPLLSLCKPLIEPAVVAAGGLES